MHVSYLSLRTHSHLGIVKMRSTPAEDIDPTLREGAIDLQKDVALQQSPVSDISAQSKQPPNDTVLPTSTPTLKRRPNSKMKTQKPPLELRERYPSGRLKEFRPRSAYSPERLAEMRKEEGVRTARYKNSLRALAVAAGHCDAIGQAAFIVELKKLRKEKREAEREARNTGMAVKSEKILQVHGAGGGGCEVQDTVHARDKVMGDS